MAKTEMPGRQIKDGTVLEKDLSLSDITMWNATPQMHGFLPKLMNSTKHFLRSDGLWIEPPTRGGSSLPLPEETFFVSPNFPDVAPHFSDIEQVMLYLDSNPSPYVVSIIVFAGDYFNSNLYILHTCAITAVGEVNILGDCNVQTTMFSIYGNVRFNGNLTIQGPGSRCCLDVAYVYNLGLDNIYNEVYIKASRGIGYLLASGSEAVVECDEIGYLWCETSKFSINSRLLYKGYVRGESNIFIRNAAIGSGNPMSAPVVNCIEVEGADVFKLQECVLWGGDEPCLYLGAVQMLFLSNTLMLTNQGVPCMEGNDAYLFLRGGCTANEPHAVNNLMLLNQMEDIIIEPDATDAIW